MPKPVASFGIQKDYQTVLSNPTVGSPCGCGATVPVADLHPAQRAHRTRPVSTTSTLRDRPIITETRAPASMSHSL
jgi:hypothetical protein